MDSPIVELRQYTLRPGQRDILIELFDREFIESQEALGARIIGQFRDLGDPDRFVWVRGFQDMLSREGALKAFYGGPVWKEHRERANSTMIDSDDVLLLRPARPGSGFSLETVERPTIGATHLPDGIVVASIYYFDDPIGDATAESFERDLISASARAGARILAYFMTESSPNTFPALPVREGENVIVCFTTAEIPDIAVRQAARRREVRRLAPTTRSLLRS
jgi:hypothetical protein